MRRIPALVLALGLIALLAIGAAVALGRGGSASNLGPRDRKPRLMLLTTLPLIFPEEFTLESSGSKALTVLETRYRVVPIGAADRASLAQGRLLLMAHALPQTAEALVDLDRWVRDGGRLLLLADPKLDWPSKRPLGDKLRPPPSFADTGLLAHWGLKLVKSAADGPVAGDIGPSPTTFSSPGGILAEKAGCDVEGKGLIARCAIGRGKATIIADADWLNVDDRSGDLQLLLRELDRLER
ncbi:hypothetical protein GCM10023264_22510 [Sphingomonas daechungensis]|uniref:hypothetical protein n=1 Tax=Sphingomonas daechungensis TaxID=1176646 RepID=UPI0031E9798E